MDATTYANLTETLKIAYIHDNLRNKKKRFREDMRKSLNMIKNKNAIFYLNRTQEGAVIWRLVIREAEKAKYSSTVSRLYKTYQRSALLLKCT